MFLIYLISFVLGIVVGFIVKDKIVAFWNWLVSIYNKIKSFFTKGV